jgi:UDP:flavonoid glycosyltransferase YjiC (YdhE family)
MAAIDAGVPQLLTLDPYHLGHKTMAPAVQMRGLGLVTHQDDVDTAILNRLLADDSLRTAATEVRAELATLPSPAVTAARLSDLVSRA